MPRRMPEQDLETIIAAVDHWPNGATARDIADGIGEEVPFRTLQYRLKHLVETSRLAREGEGRWAKYRLTHVEGRSGLVSGPGPAEDKDEAVVPLSAAGAKIRDYLRQPAATRRLVGFNRAFLDAYHPNENFYLAASERAHLAEVGKRNSRRCPQEPTPNRC